MNTKIRVGRRAAGLQALGQRVLEMVGMAVVFGAVLVGCTGGEAAEAPEAGDVLYGPEVALWGGTAQTYVVVEGGTPVEVGVTLSESLLAGLPADGAEGGMVMPDGHSTFAGVLAMPESNPTPFQMLMIDWNPAGHEPMGTYDPPHFDFHFYTIPEHELHAIDPANPEFLTLGSRTPPAERIPAGYALLPLPPVPFMGAHLVPTDSPELRPTNPERFTQTFIYGSWDGRIIFLEPMITKEVIEARQTTRFPVAVAESYDPAGYYPASYELGWSEAEAEYRIALTDLAWQE